MNRCGANATNGIRRTNADKRQAVERLLNDAEWSKWSDSEIARRAVVSHPFVAGIRVDDPTRTVTRNGTTYQQDTSNIGNKSPFDPVKTCPVPTAGSYLPEWVVKGKGFHRATVFCREGLTA